MRIGVLQAGLVPEELTPRWGEYDAIFRRLLARSGRDFEVKGWRVVEGEFPAGPHEAEGWIVSGSKHGAYEDHAFIPPLEAFIRDAVAAGAPLIGVCFGHQIIAQALGGKVEKFSGGWGLGPQEYELTAKPGWMAEAPERLTVSAVHQDQVVEAPPGATRLASSPFCENAILVYGDPERPAAITIQPHPEFDDEFLKDLIAARRGAAFPEPLAEAGLARIEAGGPRHGDWAARWFGDFLEMHRK